MEVAAALSVGALFLGPTDLHADIGYLGRSNVPEVEAKIQRAATAAQVARATISITTNVDTNLTQNPSFVTVGFDVGPPEGVAAAAKAAGP